MKATIRMVADAAGVAPSTVSRALSGTDLVSPATRRRVEDAAQRLGYQPNRVARSLVTGRMGAFGLVVPDLANPFFAGMVKGAQARAKAAGESVLVADSDEDPAAEAGLIGDLARQVDGLVLCSPRSSDEMIAGLAADTAVVLVNRRAGDLPAITVDNADGMRQAIAHLAALGHRRVGYVAGPAGSWSGEQRLAGLRAASKSAGVELAELGFFPPRFESGVAAADLVIAAGLTAVLAYNDVVALGLLSRLRVRGIEVPGEVSVVGCDDIAMAAMCGPSLTTVALPKEQAGRDAVSLLLALQSSPGNGRPVHRVLPAQLIVRQSTGPA